jgi:DNA-directed RNA polymerase specialized sigma24 family protein
MERTAKAEARKYNGILDWQDIVQEASLRYLTCRERVLAEVAAPNSYLRALVRNTAFDMADKELHARCQYTYTVSTVRKILETMNLLIEDMNDPMTIQVVEMRSDVKTCMKELPEDMQLAILKRYGANIIPGNGSSERKKLNRAVDRLTDIMNFYQGDQQFVGTRKVVSNAHARAIFSED